MTHLANASVFGMLVASFLATDLATFHKVIWLLQPFRSLGCDTSGPDLAICSDLLFGPTFIISPGPTFLFAALFASTFAALLVLQGLLLQKATIALRGSASMHFCQVSMLTSTVSQTVFGVFLRVGCFPQSCEASARALGKHVIQVIKDLDANLVRPIS